jgi:hypothetical protein
MSESSGIRRNGRKRRHPTFLAEDSTPSDPALFSSDPPDPSAEHYFAPRRKKQYRGTWWQDGTKEKRERKAFERNLDSGVFMGSDSSLESLDVEVGDELESDDTVPDETLRPDGMVRRRHPIALPRKAHTSEPANVIEVRKRIADFAENGGCTGIADPSGCEQLRLKYVTYLSEDLNLHGLTIPSVI